MRRRLSFQISDFEITGREIAFSVIIVFVMLVIGFFVSNAITNAVVESNEKYYKSTKITDQDQFQYGLKTAIGNVLAYGVVEAAEPVSIPDITGNWFYIEKVKERYTMHTRTVTTTDGNGKTHSRTEIYWTWDRVWSDDLQSDKFTFMGMEFPNTLIGISAQRADLEKLCFGNVRGNHLYESSDVRYYFNVVPSKFNATLEAKLKQNEMVGFNESVNIKVRYETTIPQIMDDLENREQAVSIIFWIVWIIVIGFSLFGFYYIDNCWLEG